MYRLITVLFLLLVCPTQAEERGLATLGILHPQFPCSLTIQALEAQGGLWLAVLAFDFGSSTRCLVRARDALRRAGKPLRIEVYLSNGSCRRFGRCGKGSFLPQYSIGRLNRALERHDPRVERAIRLRARLILSKITPITTEISLVAELEDNFTEKAARWFISILREEWPYEIIRNPVSDSSGYAGADMWEYHGVLNWPKGRTDNCIWNNDGLDLMHNFSRGALGVPLPSAEFRRLQRKNTCSRKFTHVAEFNCLTKSRARDFTQPWDRPCGGAAGGIRELIRSAPLLF